jgi:diphthine synthase
MLTFVGLGLYGERDITLAGLDCARGADLIFLEQYTSRLMGTTRENLEALFGKTVHALGRKEVEQGPEVILGPSRDHAVVLLTGGDPMVSTTHTDLRLRAHARGIVTNIIHGASIVSAISGITGLQNYRFGKSCSIPYPEGKWIPTSPFETVLQNLDRGLHTLVYLDIQEHRYMTVAEGITLLEDMARLLCREPPPFYIGVARAGARDQQVIAASGPLLRSADLGAPLHILVVPGNLHPMEREYLEAFAAL